MKIMKSLKHWKGGKDDVDGKRGESGKNGFGNVNGKEDVNGRDGNSAVSGKSGARKNGVTELVFILDRSGSMSGLENDTIGGFNAMIEKQKKQDGECYVSTVLFDNVSEVLHDRVKLADVPKMTAAGLGIGRDRAVDYHADE